LQSADHQFDIQGYAYICVYDRILWTRKKS